LCFYHGFFPRDLTLNNNSDPVPDPSGQDITDLDPTGQVITDLDPTGQVITEIRIRIRNLRVKTLLDLG